MTIRLMFVDEELPLGIVEIRRTATPYMQYYLDAIDNDAEIVPQVYRSFNDAKSVLMGDNLPFDVVSLDVMMPIDMDKDSILGARAGIGLLKTIIEKQHIVAVILLSNVHPKLLEKDIPANLGRVTKFCVLEKMTTDPFHFVSQIKEFGKK